MAATAVHLLLIVEEEEDTNNSSSKVEDTVVVVQAHRSSHLKVFHRHHLTGQSLLLPLLHRTVVAVVQHQLLLVLQAPTVHQHLLSYLHLLLLDVSSLLLPMVASSSNNNLTLRVRRIPIVIHNLNNNSHNSNSMVKVPALHPIAMGGMGQHSSNNRTDHHQTLLPHHHLRPTTTMEAGDSSSSNNNSLVLDRTVLQHSLSNSSRHPTVNLIPQRHGALEVLHHRLLMLQSIMLSSSSSNNHSSSRTIKGLLDRTVIISSAKMQF